MLGANTQMMVGLVGTMIGVVSLFLGINYNRQWLWWSGLTLMLSFLLITGTAIIPMPESPIHQPQIKECELLNKC